MVAVVGLSWVLFSPAASISKVFYAKDEALKLAFPEADQVEMRTFFLKDSELQRAQKLARTAIDSKLFTFYVGEKAGSVIGYAAIDAHIVRTLPETFMVVLSPEGEVRMTVQTGNMVYRINRAHGLQCIGKEEIADAVEGNRCYGTTGSDDC